MTENLLHILEQFEAFSGLIHDLRRQMRAHNGRNNKYAVLRFLIEKLGNCCTQVIDIIRPRNETVRPRRVGRIRRNAIDERPITPIFAINEE